MIQVPQFTVLLALFDIKFSGHLLMIIIILIDLTHFYDQAVFVILHMYI